MKRVLYITTVPDLGGVNKYLIEIVKHISDDITPYFVMTDKGYLSEQLEELGYEQNIFYVDITNKIWDIKTLLNSFKSINRIIKDIQPDIIHCNSMPGGVVGRICGLLTKTPVIYVPHSWAFTPGGRKWYLIVIYALIEMLLAVITDKIVCVSEYEKCLALKIMPLSKNKLIVIHNGISDCVNRYCYSEHSELNVVMISRFAPQKDPYTLIEAIRELNNEGLKINLDLYGYGPERNKVEGIITAIDSPNIRYLGEINDANEVLNKYDIYCLITNYESLPIGIIEALRECLPIIVSDVGGCKELIDNNGFLIPRQNKKVLKDKLKEIYFNRNMLNIFSKNSRKIYENEFNVNKMMNRIYALYQTVLKENKK